MRLWEVLCLTCVVNPAPMKPAPLLIAATLLCNILLAAICIYRYAVTPASGSDIATASSASDNAQAQTRTKANLEIADENLVAQLRTEGFPENVIRIIVADRLYKEFAPRRKALIPKPKPKSFWEYNFDHNNTRQPISEEASARQIELNKEYNDTLRTLLGLVDEPPSTIPALFSDPEKQQRANTYGDLSEEKIMKIETIRKDYNVLRDKINKAMNGIRFPDDAEQLAFLDQEQRADIANILTPDELYEYELRTSERASSVKKQIQHFFATEEEYKNLYAVQHVFDEKYANVALTPEQARTLREEMAKAVLSAERYNEYVVTTAEDYFDIKYLVEYGKLPAETIASVINIQRDITNRADAIRRDATIIPADRDAQLAALGEEAKAKLRPVLGEKAYPNYTSGETGKWINKLTPKKTAK